MTKALKNMSDEELIEAQQENSVKRGEAEKEFKTRGQEIQFELDKRSARSRFGGGLSEAEKEALAELAAEKESATNG